MSDWLTATLERAQAGNDCVAEFRGSSLAKLKTVTWPSRKTEDWRYTSLHALKDASFSIDTGAAQSVAVEPIGSVDSLDLHFVNGQLQSIPSTLPEGLTISALKDLTEQQQSQLTQSFAQIKHEKHVFGLVNDVLAQDIVLISVAEGCAIDSPVRLINSMAKGFESHTRVVVRLEAAAKLSVIEQYEGQEASFNTAFAEYDIAAEAELEHYRFALQSGDAMNIGGSHFRLKDQSKLNSTIVGFGSELSRVDVDVLHEGQHADAKMNVVYLLDGSELFDLHSNVEHRVPHSTTEQNVRGIVADQSTAVFNGRIHIHPDAQKTLAELNNRNLLLSRNAQINTKPELEIYADDVRCAHGATIAEIDKTALYYLRSRGISENDAQVMLNFGFINELVDQMPNQALADWLCPQLRARFAAMKIKS